MMTMNMAQLNIEAGIAKAKEIGRRDVATASLIEVWIDEAERRTWFPFEAGRDDAWR